MMFPLFSGFSRSTFAVVSIQTPAASPNKCIAKFYLGFSSAQVRWRTTNVCLLCTPSTGRFFCENKWKEVQQQKHIFACYLLRLCIVILSKIQFCTCILMTCIICALSCGLQLSLSFKPRCQTVTFGILFSSSHAAIIQSVPLLRPQERSEAAFYSGASSVSSLSVQWQQNCIFQRHLIRPVLF